MIRTILKVQIEQKILCQTFLIHFVITAVKPFRLEIKGGPSSMGCRERGSHALGVYPRQDTSRMGTARMKQEEETNTRMIARE